MDTWKDHPCFYITMLDGPRCALLAGPYQTKDEAEEFLPLAREWATEASGDLYAWLYTFGVSKWQNGQRLGLMQKLGIANRAMVERILHGKEPAQMEFL